MAIHEHIRQDGEKELERDAMALFWSAIAAGLSMSASLLAKGIFHVQFEGIPGGLVLENLGYTFGFVIVIMAREGRRSSSTSIFLPRLFSSLSTSSSSVCLSIFSSFSSSITVFPQRSR
jgi:formate/nitrite transporter FocA (FNT family)